MRLAILFVAFVAILGSSTEVLAQDSSQEKVASNYYIVIPENCPGKNLKITLKDGRKLSGKCHAQLTDHLQIIHEGVIYKIPYTNMAKITARRSWVRSCFGKVKDTVIAPYVYMYTEIGGAIALKYP